MNLDIGTFIAIVGVVITLALLLPFVQGARRKATLELVEKELEIEREARRAQGIRCDEEIARLAGRLDVITKDFARVIATEVIRVLRADGGFK